MSALLSSQGLRWLLVVSASLSTIGLFLLATATENTDLFALHQWIKNKPVDLIIGNTYGKYISRVENIPFVRFGFPQLDRMGHRYFPSVGYMGALRLMELINDALLDKKDRECPDEYFELVQ